MKNKIFRIVIVVVVCLFIISLAKDFIITSVASQAVTKVTGAKTHIGWVSLSFLRQSLTIKDLKIYNPQGFSKDVLLDMPLFKGSLDVGSLLKGKLKLFSVEVDLKQVLMEKNSQGKLNVDSLTAAQQSKEAEREKEPQKQMAFMIDTLILNIGKIISKDYSSGPEPVVRAFDVNIHKSYKNITSVQQLILLVLSESLKSAGIHGAAIYGAAALTGVGIVPITVVSVLTGKDSVSEEFNMSTEALYAKTLNVLKRLGQVTKEEKAEGMITAIVSGANVTVTISSTESNKAKVNISARKYFLPKRDIADGILYELTK